MLVVLVFIVLIAFGFFLKKSLVKVDEGTAIAVTLFGKFKRIIFQWENHWMDKDWNIWRKDEQMSSGTERKKIRGRILGGLFFYGLWPFYRIHRYLNRWSDIRLLPNGKLNVQFHEEWMRKILLKPAVYAISLFKVETAPPERIPVDLIFIITLKIRNPYRFLFVGPPTPIEDVLARLGATLRQIVTSLTTDDLLRIKGAQLWTENQNSLLEGEKLIEETLKKWGLELADKGIEIREIEFPPEYQKANALRREEELRAEARAETIVGTLLAAWAKSRGKNEEEIQKEINEDPEKRKEFLETAKDLLTRLLGMETGSYVDVRVAGAEGLERLILNALALWGRIPKKEGRKTTYQTKKEIKKEDNESLKQKIKEHLGDSST